MRQPTPEEVRGARAAAGLTQEEAAALVWAGQRAWLWWESDGPHHRKMPLAAFELFCLKTGLTAAFFKPLEK